MVKKAVISTTDIDRLPEEAIVLRKENAGIFKNFGNKNQES